MTVPALTPDTTAPCPQPYQPVGWTRQRSRGPVETLGFVSPISGVEVLGRYEQEQTVPTPAGFLYGFYEIDIPGRGTFSLFGPATPSFEDVAWLISDTEALPFAQPNGFTIGGFDRLALVDAGNAVYLEHSTSGRGGATFYRWRFDDPCAPPPTPAAATAVDAVAAFTG